MRAVLSCAGAYVSGDRGSHACPAGSVRIEAESACRTAATAAGKSAGTSESPFVETDPTSPRGCYYDNNNVAWFNTHAVGAGLSGSQLLCAALATTGAPLKRRRRTDSRACRHRACAARPSWAACVIHGRHIDAHTYINRYIYTYIYLYDSDGARRRCRARRTGGHGHVLRRVLKNGAQKRCSKTVRKGGTEKRCSKRGTQKRVHKKGYSNRGT
jgi:hypothetical protein